ncbi:MAG: 4-(cytidine 5'-diphospho)-2-C-methyl-D-erythritol kinase, partial [Chromatiales bacterium]|nr:4-(cytidine 5'-diphospho)-2-C-methyl-D-erythritol kinase [Chromatiales bacterium]
LPMGGGIGGGSSDAATVLVALNAMWGLHLTLTELATVGAKLGADVPVFVHGHACWAEGIGEKMTFLEVEEVPLLVVIPGPQVPTAEIFSHEDLTRDSTPLTIDGFPSAHGLRNPRQLMSAGNVCEAIAGQLYPQIGECLSWLASLGPTRMSGTGATCFCLLEHDDKPVPPVRDWQLRTVNTLNVSPLAYAVERWQKSSDGV